MIKQLLFVSLLCVILLSLSSEASTRCDLVWKKINHENDLDELYKPLQGLCGDAFRKELWAKIATNKYLSYKKARKIMFSFLDNNDGVVCGVYSGTCIRTEGIPDHTKFNTEHSWCQSWGAVGKAKSDLHHLYPVRSKINSKRNNYPFCNVARVTWTRFGSRFGKSLTNTTCFEPPKIHKGELARSMFYFSVRYSRPIDPEQEHFFRKWSREYPVSKTEYLRNEDIYKFQWNRNPFVKYPDFVKLITDF